MKARIDFRPEEGGDREFLCRLYASTRTEELAVLDWSQHEKDAFLRMQFEAQHRHYHEAFPEARFLIVQLEGKAIGRLYLDRREDEIRVVDIALLPEHRQRGIGRDLLEDVLEEAAGKGLAVRIHVEKNNPAMRLYRRLGFVKIGDQGPYDLMEWRRQSTVPAGEKG